MIGCVLKPYRWCDQLIERLNDVVLICEQKVSGGGYAIC